LPVTSLLRLHFGIMPYANHSQLQHAHLSVQTILSAWLGALYR
jgi:hypothetical protein